MKKLLTAEDAAEIMNMDIHSIRRWLKLGLLKGEEAGEGQWRIAPEALQDFMERYRLGANYLKATDALTYGKLALVRLAKPTFPVSVDLLKEFEMIFMDLFNGFTEEEVENELARLFPAQQ